MAVTECSARASDGRWVTVTVETQGATGIPVEGEVVFVKDENKFGYRFTREDISQFFEYDEPADNTAMVGLFAYVQKEAPVSIKYNGPNFVDMDLKTVIMENKTQTMKNNFLRVWKGPGYASQDQLQLTSVACSTWPNI